MSKPCFYKVDQVWLTLMIAKKNNHVKGLMIERPWIMIGCVDNAHILGIYMRDKKLL